MFVDLESRTEERRGGAPAMLSLMITDRSWGVGGTGRSG